MTVCVGSLDGIVTNLAVKRRAAKRGILRKKGHMYSGVRTELSRRFSASPKMRKTGNGVVVAAGGIYMPLLAQDAVLLPELYSLDE